MVSLDRLQTFVDKHEDLSNEEGSKIPAVEVKKDLQWCRGQLRGTVKAISKHFKMLKAASPWANIENYFEMI